tara:strand:- start:15980 stop:18283 length:2304 start_codon:yes stop_codon:yes gene_type:complete
MSDQIRFEVETERVLEILTREIYDSPLALLRENVQNAYDAVLMRCARDGVDIATGRIEVTLDGSRLHIKDNGIGMIEDVLRNNFWKAGSSGKRNELAYQAGVIGTFGIGAMANFGIATRLELVTRSIESDVTLTSIAERDRLSIAEECISLERLEDDREQGTEVTVTLEPGVQLSPEQAKQYLLAYVKYVPVQILLNGELISTQVLDTSVPFPTEQLVDLGSHSVNDDLFEVAIRIGVNPQGMVRAEVTNVRMSDCDVAGSLLLSQGAGGIMGYRNFFGLAAAPVSTVFQLGGIANLAFLTPTAGREALGRDSIAHVQRILTMTEGVIAENIARTEFADRNTCFHTYITNHNRYDLAGKVTVEVHPEKDSVSLEHVTEYGKGRNLHYYAGRDASLIQQFSSPDIALIQISQSNPRRQIQTQYVTQTLKIEQIPDHPTVTKEYSPHELSVPEAALSIRIAATLGDDYFLNEVEIRFVDITHGVQFLVEGNQQKAILRIARRGGSVVPLLECYSSAPEVFSDFVKDFVRNNVYPHVKSLVPSSTQGGADALRQILRKNRELYRYEDTDLGALEPILADYLSGETSLGEAIRKARTSKRPQEQNVSSDQVGNVEAAIPDVVNSPVESPEGTSDTEPRPAILREDIDCEFKILTATEKHDQLNGFTLFLGLSDRLFRRESIFFKSPHTTRVIWGGHRVIYIFDHPSGSITLYYDIELRSPLAEHQASGGMVPSTTLILKNRLFVPVPDELVGEFRITEGAKQFYVNFDTIP